MCNFTCTVLDVYCEGVVTKEFIVFGNFFLSKESYELCVDIYKKQCL